MTPAARPVEQTAPAPAARTTSRRRAPAVSSSWLALPALVMFVAFGLVPLVGVLLLSFTTWDGLGAIHFTGLVSWRAVLQ